MTDNVITKETFFYEKNIEKLEQIVEKQEIKLNEKAQTEKDLLQKLEEKNNSITKLQEELQEQKVKLAEISQNEKELSQQVDSQEKEAVKYRHLIAGKNNIISELRQEIEEQENTLELMKNETDELNRNVTFRDRVIEIRNKKIQELELVILPPADMQFYRACKLDLALFQLSQKDKKIVTVKELLDLGINADLLEKTKTEPFESTNFTLTFSNNSFTIKIRKK